MDKPGRESLACDTLEPLRPLIDARVFKWVSDHKFAPEDFIRLRSGEVRLGSAFAKVFSQETALPQADIERACEFMLGLINDNGRKGC